MALDPLKFLVEIQDKASSQLDDLETKINKVLKDRSFKISIEGIGEIKAALSQISSTLQLTGNNDVIAKFEPRIKALKEQLNSSKDLTEQYAKLISTIENRQANLSNLLSGGGNSKYFDAQIRKAIESYQLMLNDIKAGRDQGLLSESHLKSIQRNLGLLASMYQNVEKEASKYNRTQERASAIQQKYEAAVQKTYSNLSIRQNDAGLQGISTAMDNIMTKLSKVREDIDLYRAAIGAGNKESIDFGQKGLREAEKEAESLMRQYVALADALDRLRAGGKEQPLLSTVQSNKELEMLNEAFRKGESELQKQARADTQALKEQEQAEKAAAKAAKEQAKAEKENADGMAQAGKAASNLNRNLEKLNISGLRNRAREAGVDTSAFDAAVRAVERYQQALANIHTNGGVWTMRDEVGLTNANNNLQIQTALLKKQTLDAEAAAKATSQLTAEEQRLASALNQSTQAGKSHSQILGDLKSLATQYIGVWGAQNFLHNIIETGGQLERQRLSMGAILADAQKANVLFGQIKDLAIKSPFGVVELDQYSKQLAAYGFQYHELYDMTKRLADISAGAGTDISRIALALGHVRSEGALSGYTLRQFAMNNIPMIRMLSEQLSEVEGKLVSTAEIRERVSKKQIGYDDVIAVIKKLTDEGGMFYNMQETIAESVSAKFKNLKDSMDIMYGEMAESKLGDILKSTATSLTELTRHWKVLVAVFATGVAYFGIARLNTFLYNKALQSTIASVTMGKAAFEGLTRSQVKQMAVSGALSRESLLLAVATKKLTVYQAEQAAAHYGVSRAQLQQIRTTTALRGASSTLGGIFSTIFSPKMLAFAGIELVITAVTKYFEWVNKIDEKTKEMMDLTKSRILDLERAQKNIESGKPNDTLGLKSAIEDMQTVLANSNLYTKTIDEQIKKAGTLSEKYDILAGSISTAIDKQKQMLDVQDTIGEAIKASSWGFLGDDSEFNNLKNIPWFNNDITKNMGDVNKSYASLRKIIDGAWEYKDALKAAIEEMINAGKISEDFRNQLENAPFEEQIRLLAESSYWNEIVGNIDGFEEAAGRIKKATSDVTDDWNEIANDDIPKMFSKIAKLRGIEEKEFREWCVENPDQLNIMLNALLDRLDVAEPKIRQRIKRMWFDFARIGKLEKGLAEGAIVGASILGSINFDELFPVDEKADLDPEKQKPKEKNKSKTDENAKAVRERVRIIKEAADAFQYWRDKVGDKAAWSHVMDEFGDILKKIGITSDNVQDLRGNLDNVLNSDEFKAIKDKKVQAETEKEIAKEKSQLNRKDFEKTAEEFSSKVQIELDSLTRAWEIFNNVREATGNVELAVEISGANYAGGKTRNLADALKEKIQRDFDMSGNGIDFDINLSDKDIEEKIKAAMPKVNEDRIKGLVEEYKKWRDLQRDVLKSDISIFTGLVSSAQDYESQLQRINDKLKKQIEANNQLAKNGTISQKEADKANKIATVQAEDEKWKASLTYNQLMNDSLALTREEVENGINRAMEHLNALMQNNLISAQDYANEMEKIRNIQSEWTKNSFFGTNGRAGAYASGGLSGLINYYKRLMKKDDAAMASLTQQKGEYDFGLTDKLIENLKRKKAKEGENVEELGDLQDVLNDFEALSKAIEPVINLFDQLGMTSLSGVLSAGQSALSSATSIGGGAAALFGASAGPWGAAIGAGMSILGSILSTHDDSLQEQIDAIDREVNALEQNTNAIKTFRDRTLGYDTGELRRLMANLYSNTTRQKYFPLFGETLNYESAALKAMQDFYKMNSGGTGYAQELENLKKQREDYIKMYDLEADKKKSSQDALDEYRAKIAELDEQIAYFAQDLANELYGIDLKGWGDQIGDALMTAFENGEDAAKAFKYTVQDIMRQVLRKMLSIGIIEPMMEKLQKKLFGDNGSGGSFDASNPEGTIDAAMRDVAEFFGDNGEGQKMIAATQAFYEKWEDLMRSYGLTLADESNSSSSGSSIKSITEQTADLIASYINAIRADESVIRALATQYFPMYYAAIMSGNASLKNIENHTSAIMRSNDAIERSNQAILDRIDGLRNKTWKVPVS